VPRPGAGTTAGVGAAVDAMGAVDATLLREVLDVEQQLCLSDETETAHGAAAAAAGGAAEDGRRASAPPPALTITATAAAASVAGPPPPPPGARSGWLSKRTANGRGWRKRWFVVDGSWLRYFASERDAAKHEAAAAAAAATAAAAAGAAAAMEQVQSTLIPLAGEYTLRLESAPPQTAFQLITPERTWELRAESRADAVEWLGALRRGIELLRGARLNTFAQMTFSTGVLLAAGSDGGAGVDGDSAASGARSQGQEVRRLATDLKKSMQQEAVARKKLDRRRRSMTDAPSEQAATRAAVAAASAAAAAAAAAAVAAGSRAGSKQHSQLGARLLNVRRRSTTAAEIGLRLEQLHAQQSAAAAAAPPVARRRASAQTRPAQKPLL
jgi:trimeric autotransporter adhesin